jgi:hypothetical protein
MYAAILIQMEKVVFGPHRMADTDLMDLVLK